MGLQITHGNQSHKSYSEYGSIMYRVLANLAHCRRNCFVACFKASQQGYNRENGCVCRERARNQCKFDVNYLFEKEYVATKEMVYNSILCFNSFEKGVLEKSKVLMAIKNFAEFVIETFYWLDTLQPALIDGCEFNLTLEQRG